MGGTEKNKRRVENEDRREGILESRNEFVKIPIIPPSRAYAYARTNRRFIFFAVTSVTAIYVSYCNTMFYCVFVVYFNSWCARVFKNRDWQLKKRCFFFLPFPAFSSTCLPTSVPCVTLVTAKKQHRCWNTRATHTREKTSSATCLPNDRLSLYDCFAMSIFHILMYWKEIMHFSPIFSLFGAISPHILIGRCEKSVLRSSSFILRWKPIYQIHSSLCLF